MFLIILSILLFIAAFVGLGFKRFDVEIDGCVEDVIKWKINFKQVLSLLAFILIIPACIARVPANSVGILYSPFTGTSEITL